MNDDQESQVVESQVEQEVERADEVPSSSPEVGFPLSPRQKEKSSKAGLIILIVVALLGVGIFFLTKRAGEKEIEPTETPTVTSSPTPTSTAAPVDKSKVEIEVQNGTGISGEAAYLQGKLRDADYTNIAVGNASVQDAEDTVVTFQKDLSQEVVDEITELLEDTYTSVDVKTSSTQSKDVVIVTGLRKGQTAKPSATSSATPKASASASASPTATPKP